MSLAQPTFEGALKHSSCIQISSTTSFYSFCCHSNHERKAEVWKDFCLCLFFRFSSFFHPRLSAESFENRVVKKSLQVQCNIQTQPDGVPIVGGNAPLNVAGAQITRILSYCIAFLRSDTFTPPDECMKMTSRWQKNCMSENRWKFMQKLRKMLQS